MNTADWYVASAIGNMELANQAHTPESQQSYIAAAQVYATLAVVAATAEHIRVERQRLGIEPLGEQP